MRQPGQNNANSAGEGEVLQIVHPEESMLDKIQDFVQQPVGMAVVAAGVVGVLFLVKGKKKAAKKKAAPRRKRRMPKARIART